VSQIDTQEASKKILEFLGTSESNNKFICMFDQSVRLIDFIYKVAGSKLIYITHLNEKKSLLQTSTSWQRNVPFLRLKL
jgi:hypothetical protein